MSPALLRRIDSGRLAWSRAESTLPDVTPILNAVRNDGDRALTELAQRFGDEPPREVDPFALLRAYEALDPDLRVALSNAAMRISHFASAQKETLSAFSMQRNGFRMGQRLEPIDRIGVYVPAGRYPLPSSLLMCAIPARVAGVSSIIVCSPRASTEVLAAAYLAGVDRFFIVGGAQAIAAMAYGTRMIARVDLIAGPGNAYVAAAKRAVFGTCGIDAIAGPSEDVVIASGDADAELIAADLLAQAEHDERARVLLLTDDSALIARVEMALSRQLSYLPTAEIARSALLEGGGASVVSLDDAIERANEIAPEHLHLHGAAAVTLADRARNYGALFIGSGASPVFGDYGAGPNHVLPTNGTARFSSGLSVFTFLRVRTFLESIASPDETLVRETATIAHGEGLFAHARAATRRLA